VWLTSIKATKGDCIADKNTPRPVPEDSKVLQIPTVSLMLEQVTIFICVFSPFVSTLSGFT